jgi:DNA polymerase-1
LRTLLIDGDIVAYTIACQTQINIDWDDDGDKFAYADPELARSAVVSYLKRLKRELEADAAIVCMSDPTRRYFRHDVFPAYKSHRTQGKIPVVLTDVRGFMRTGSAEFPSKTVLTLEADDVLGVLATHPTLVKGEKVVVSSDKDLKQIPGRHYNLRSNKWSEVTEGEADHWFYTQILTGDPTDGFSGCPGIGPVKAEQCIAFSPDHATTWFRIVGLYQKKGLTEADALVQARVARILRHTDYDFKEKRVKLWTPSVPTRPSLPSPS